MELHIGDRVQHERKGWAVVTSTYNGMLTQALVQVNDERFGVTSVRWWPLACIVASVRARPGQVVTLP